MGWLLAATVLLAVWPLPGLAATPQLKATVDRTRASQSEPIVLTLTLSSDASLQHVPSPSLDLSAFEVLGPEVRETVDLISGHASRQIVYTLYGRQPGKHIIGPARLDLGTQVLQTGKVQVEITRQTRRRPRADSGQADDATTDGNALEDNLFVRVTADRDTVYVGQQVGVRFDLCYRYNLRSPRLSEIPSFPGFWVKELFVAQRLDPKRETIDGKDFHVAPLRQVALFPTSDGTQVVQPLGLSCSILSNRSRGSIFDALSLFDDPIFGRSQSVVVRSEPLDIEVLPLPLEGQPADFTGAVGTFEVHVEAEPRQVQVGDPVTVRVEVVGIGNVQAIPAPDLSPSGFTVYEPNTEMEEGRVAGDLYGGRRKLEYILIPDRGGRLEIPALSISYFDPKTSRYQTASSAPIEVLSQGSDAVGDEEPAYGLTRHEIEELGRDIRHIKPDVEHLGAPSTLYRSVGYWLAHALLPIAYAALLLWQRHARRLEGDVAYARRRRARRELTRRLQAARGRVGSAEGFHAALQEAVVAFIADQLNRPVPGLTRDVCRHELAAHGVSAALVERVDAILEVCEFGRYAPGADDLAARTAQLTEVEETVLRLQETWS